MTNNIKILFLLFFQIFTITTMLSQSLKKEIVAGIFVNPVIASNHIQSDNVEMFTDTITYRLFQKSGINYGMIIRMNMGERLSVHSGLSYTQRNYDINIFTDDSVFTDSSLKFISYEIPVVFSGYVKLAKRLFLASNLGFSLDFYPTDISIPHVWGKRRNWSQFAIKGGFGLEFRTDKSGYFYAGTSYHYHFNDMLYVLFYKSNMIGLSDKSLPLSGNYLSLSFIYFFSSNK